MNKIDMRIASNKQEAELMIEELELQNQSLDLAIEQVQENLLEIEELKKWL